MWNIYSSHALHGLQPVSHFSVCQEVKVIGSAIVITVINVCLPQVLTVESLISKETFIVKVGIWNRSILMYGFISEMSWYQAIRSLGIPCVFCYYRTSAWIDPVKSCCLNLSTNSSQVTETRHLRYYNRLQLKQIPQRQVDKTKKSSETNKHWMKYNKYYHACQIIYNCNNISIFFCIALMKMRFFCFCFY